MVDDIRITKTENGATIMVNVTAINEFIHQASVEGAMDILKNGINAYLEKEVNESMEKKRKSQIRKWDEVGGAVETEIDEMTAEATEEPGMGPAISKHPMKGIEDMVEQNDNNLDGVINNLRSPKPAAQVTSEDVIEAEQKKKSVLEKIRETVPNDDIYLRDHDIRDMDEFTKRASDSATRFAELSQTIKDAEKRMAEIAVLKTHIINYSKTKDVYVAYRKAGYSKQFFEAHREEILLHKAAKEAFGQLEGGVPKLKDLNREYSELLKKKKDAYTEYRRIKEENKELQMAKHNLERFLNEQEEEQKEKQKSKSGQML